MFFVQEMSGHMFVHPTPPYFTGILEDLHDYSSSFHPLYRGIGTPDRASPLSRAASFILPGNDIVLNVAMLDWLWPVVCDSVCVTVCTGDMCGC